MQAIETVYKGYRFRSRLEARWAVFFDKLGIKWEYEKEGFDLGNGTRYLPDFWLPELDIWVEIKPEIEVTKSVSVYMAGKIEPNDIDWRSGLLNLPTDNGEGVIWIRGGYQYAGPFYEDLGHSEIEHVFEKCTKQIDKADYVFAWIDSDNRYGTVFELGYAYARNKQIYIASPEDYEYYDYWFSITSASSHILVPDCKHGFIEQFGSLNKTDAAKKCALLSSSGKNVLLVRGTPDDETGVDEFVNGDLVAYNGHLVFPYPKHYRILHKGWKWGDDENLLRAYKKARSARFEYGEHGDV